MPDDRAALLRLDLPADQGAARQARAAIGSALSTVVSPDSAEVLVLLASELVTNAVLHAHSAPTVVVWLEPSSVRLEVRDQSATPPRIRHYGPLSTTGRGLRLLEHLTTRWGVVTGTTGKTVWFELDTRTDPAPVEAAFIFDLDAIEPW